MLTKPINTWTIEDFHQIRIYLRKLRLNIWILKKNKSKFEKPEFNQLMTLDKSIKNLLSATGKIRDFDVTIDLLKKYKIESSSEIKSIQKLKKIEKLKLNKNWPVQKRKNLNETICQIQKILFIKKNFNINSIKKITYKQYKKLFSKKPKSKLEWHLFRKRLRRVTYLYTILNSHGKKERTLVEFQKTLGKIHDLENLQKVVKIDQLLLKRQNTLIKKSLDFFRWANV